ncbi:MAG: hypothetical protein GY859_33255 [Desulfobacterales bacterium]|nr:hypothetical protein [Desulfobacterales bacterium]
MNQKKRIPASPTPRTSLVRGLRTVLLALAAVLSWGVHAPAAEPRPPAAAVIVSLNKRPYVEAAEGAREVLVQSAGAEVETVSLDRLKDAQLDALYARLSEKKLDLIIAVGPGAARFVWTRFKTPVPRRFYTILLNPDSVIDPSRASCGVSMNIPPGVQLEMIARALPSARRIGLLLDPVYNARFLDEAVAAAAPGMEIIPLRVSSRKEILGVLKEHWRKIDALWMIPDHTVSFETLIKHVIREGVKRDTPTIGYNRFFYKSGAALAFVFDYAELGRQCGRAALEALAGKGCPERTPLFHVWMNARVMKKLDLAAPATIQPPIEEGP